MEHNKPYLKEAERALQETKANAVREAFETSEKIAAELVSYFI